MKALLDTHAFLWAASDPSKFSFVAKEVCESADLLLSVASIWEIVIKNQIGRLSLGENPRTFITRQLAAGQISVLAISANHALRVGGLPLSHRDPFDRMLAAQSLEEDIPLISRDPIFQLYQVKTIW